MKKIQYLPINWEDGMKITQKDFCDDYFHTIELIKDYNATNQNSFEYGLLEPIDTNNGNLDLEFSNESNTLRVTLKSCHLITKLGYRILFYDELYGAEQRPFAIVNLADVDANTEGFFIILSVNPYEGIPVGVPNPEEVPLHHPYILPKIKLEIIPYQQINTSFLDNYFLVVGEIHLKEKILAENKTYIPAVKKVAYHTETEKFRADLCKTIGDINKNAIGIIKKNNGNERTNHLGTNTCLLCQNSNNFYTQNSFFFNNIASEYPPIVLVERLTHWAHQLSISINLMEDRAQEELLQYYYEWIDVKPSEFTATIENVINLHYNHMNIAPTLNTLQLFITMIHKLFEKMSGLEYIGQRRDNIVVSQELPAQKEKGKNSSIWSMFD